MNFQSTQIMNQRTQPRLSSEIMKISDHQLGSKFRSKYDIYTYMTETLHKYLPPKESINKDFIRQVLKNDKEVFDMADVKQIKVPKYEELSVQDDELVKKYLPDQGTKTKTIDRKFFYDILNTIYPDFVRQLLDHAQNLRNQPELNETKKEFILITDSWNEQLMSHPFISKKPGKTIQLLKESTKMYKARHPRDKKELGITLKRFKGMEQNQEQLNFFNEENYSTIQEDSFITNVNEQKEKGQKKKKFNI